MIDSVSRWILTFLDHSRQTRDKFSTIIALFCHRFTVRDTISELTIECYSERCHKRGESRGKNEGSNFTDSVKVVGFFQIVTDGDTWTGSSPTSHVVLQSLKNINQPFSFLFFNNFYFLFFKDSSFSESSLQLKIDSCNFCKIEKFALTKNSNTNKTNLLRGKESCRRDSVADEKGNRKRNRNEKRLKSFLPYNGYRVLYKTSLLQRTYRTHPPCSPIPFDRSPISLFFFLSLFFLSSMLESATGALLNTTPERRTISPTVARRFASTILSIFLSLSLTHSLYFSLSLSHFTYMYLAILHTDWINSTRNENRGKIGDNEIVPFCHLYLTLKLPTISTKLEIFLGDIEVKETKTERPCNTM